jgi:hypothetical protein
MYSHEPDHDLVVIARQYVDRRFSGRRRSNVLQCGVVPGRWDEDFCRRVALWYDREPDLAYGAELSRLYDRFIWETSEQYRTIVDAGIRVAPWRRPGQPYAGSAQLRAEVRATSTIYVYLTSVGHGDRRSAPYHPLRKPSGITVDGVEFAANDLFRAVHDVFGHVMHGYSFSARGEFSATYCHMQMYSTDVHAVLFAEQVTQICWYYYGPHLREGGSRRYPDQKILQVPAELLEQFKAMFTDAGRGVPVGPTDA